MSKKAERKILFVSHKSNMSGAPLLLLEIIREFKRQSSIPFQVLMMEDGVLAAEFKLLGETFIWQKKATAATGKKSGLNKLFSKAFDITSAAKILFHLRGTSLIFFNTISNGHILKKLMFLKAKHICYVHELETAIHMTTNRESLQVVLQHTDLFIACSAAVKSNLASKHLVPQNSIQVLPTPASVIYRNKKDYTAFIQSFKSINAVPVGAVIIGVIAFDEWRKGFDLFLPLISLYTNMHPASNVYFVWKGCNSQSPNRFFNQYDIKKFGQSNCLLLPHGDDSIETMSCFDIHLLISREDPYPLVVLEAATFGIPTVSFSGAGGSVEFIEADAGITVPYGNLLSMAAALHLLVEDNALRSKMGGRAQEKMLERHSKKLTMPAFISTIEELSSLEKIANKMPLKPLPLIAN